MAANPPNLLRVFVYPFVTKGNPYCPILYENLAKIITLDYFTNKKKFKLFAKRPHILHFNWVGGIYSHPSKAVSSLKFFFFLKLLSLLRYCGTKVVWTAHNLIPHNSRETELEMKRRRLFLKQVDGVITLSSNMEGLVRNELHYKGPLLRTHHVEYSEYFAPLTQRFQLQRSGNTKTFLCLGQISAYKGFDYILDALPHLAPDCRIVVAGKPDGSVSPEKLDLLRNSCQVTLVDRFLEDYEVAELLRSCTALLMPYKEVDLSGNIFLASTFGTPIIGPLRSSWMEYLNEDCGLFLNTLSGSLLAEAMNNFPTEKENSMRGRVQIITKQISNTQIAQDIVSFYQKLML